MTLTPTLSIPLSTANCRLNWKSASMGVEFLFMGGYSLPEQVKQIGNFWHCGSQLLIADPILDKRSGRYRLKTTVPT